MVLAVDKPCGSEFDESSPDDTPEFRTDTSRRKQRRRIALSLAGVLVASALLYVWLHYEANRTFMVSGEVRWEGGNGFQAPSSANGTKVSVYDASLPDRYRQFPPDYDNLWLTHELLSVREAHTSTATWLARGAVCKDFAATLAKQFGGSMLPVESRFLYRPFKTSTLEEWREIESDPEFRSLSFSKQTDVRYVFWIRRVTDSKILSVQDKENIQKIIFPGPLEPDSQEAMNKAGISDEKLDAIDDAPLSLAATLTDSDGKFSVLLKKGAYLLVVQDEVPAPYEIIPGFGTERATALWVKRVEVAGPTKTFLTESWCSP
jgi:hypothetical protein